MRSRVKYTRQSDPPSNKKTPLLDLETSPADLFTQVWMTLEDGTVVSSQIQHPFIEDIDWIEEGLFSVLKQVRLQSQHDSTSQNRSEFREMCEAVRTLGTGKD